MLLLGTPILWWSFIPALAGLAWFGISRRDWVQSNIDAMREQIQAWEETGRISIANNGHLVSNLDEGKLRKVLGILYRPPGSDQLPWIRGWNGNGSAGAAKGPADPRVDEPKAKV